MIARFVALFSILFLQVAGAAEFTVPPLSGPVVDQARILDGRTIAILDNGLRNLLTRGGTQVNVLTVSSLEGLPIEQASIKVTDAWKLGTAKDDKGVLLLVAPNDRKLRIEVGQGLEGVLTDADSKRIIAETITPLFREGRFDDGIASCVIAIMQKTNPELDPNDIFGMRRPRTRELPVDTSLGKLIRLALIVLFILFIIRPRRRRRGFASGLMWGGATGWGAGRSWGGGGGFGGGGGGGSWGGGGGGFSGGGASGSW